MKKEYYTIGEIFRQQLINRSDGQPYANKITIGRIVRGLKYKEVMSKYGPSKVVTMEQIKEYNKKIRKIYGNRLAE